MNYVHVARMGEMRPAYKILVRNPEVKSLHKRPRCRWEDKDSIKTNLKEVGCEAEDWIQLAQDSPMAGVCEHGSERTFGFHKVGNFGRIILKNDKI
jgi:hypothetical protein